MQWRRSTILDRLDVKMQFVCSAYPTMYRASMINRGQQALHVNVMSISKALVFFDVTVWPSGLRRWLEASVRKGVGSNPTAVIIIPCALI